MGRGYTIGEAAKLLHVSRDTLRFYEKKKLAAPSKAENTAIMQKRTSGCCWIWSF